MKSGKLKNALIIGSTSLLVIGLWILATPCPVIQRPMNMPGYIESVWPSPESQILLGCYIRRYVSPLSGIGVGVMIDMDSIWKLEVPEAGNEEVPSFPNRVRLYVDEEQVAITERAEGGGTYFIGDTDLDLAGWYSFSSNHFIPPGKHVAKLIIVTRTGAVLEYDWQFEIK